MIKLQNQSLIAVAVMGLTATSADAQQSDFYNRDKYEAVEDRRQPDFDPEQARVGTFLVDSALELGVSATDNVFAASGDDADNPEESDTFFTAAIDADARTDWSNHEIGLRGRVETNEYSDFGDESFTAFDVGANGRLDVTRDFFLTASTRYRDSVQPRANYANGSQLDSPVDFTRTDYAIGATYQNDRIRWNNTLRLTESDFDNGFNRVTSEPFIQDFRDNEDLNFTTRLSYAISPNIAVFGQGTATQTDYDSVQTFQVESATMPGTFETATRVRDSEGYIVAAGVDFETTNLIRGDIAIGFFSEDKEDDNFEDVDGLSIDGTMQWFPSRLTTVGFTAGRRVLDNGIIESPSTLVTSFGASIDHEFSRQVVGSLYGDFSQDEFQEIDRDDDYTTIGAGLTYKLNKRMHLTGQVQSITRDASGTFNNAFDPSFTANEVGVKLSIFP
ncbi:MAG: outer membrane beta-barrel protein [Pseudomonadota bacterium]